jgi:hypothetical protein
MNITEIRKKYPQYSDVSDTDLAKGFHSKFYSDMPYEEFASKIGVGKMYPAGGGKGGFSGMAYMSPERLQYAEERNTVGKSLSKLPGDIGRAIDDTIRTMANTGSLGFADKFAAGMNANITGADYQNQLAVERARSTEARKRMGPAATLADISGIALTAPLLGSISPTARVAPALSGSFVGRNIATPAVSALEGAAYGGLAAAGNDQNIAEGATSGALVGGGLGVGLNMVSGLMKAGLRKYDQMKAWGETSNLPKAQKEAFDIALSELQASGLTPSQALAKAQELGPTGVIADVTPGLQLAAGSVASKAPGASNIIAKNLTPRFEGAPSAVKEVLNKTVGPVTDPQAVRAATDALRKGASPLFQSIGKYAVPVDDTVKMIDDALSVAGPNTTVGKMLTEARNKLTDRSGNLISNGQAVLAARDDIQIMVDEAFKRSGTLGNAIKPIRDSLNNSIVSNVPDRKIANELYRASKLMDESYDYGRGLLSGGPSSITPGQLNDYMSKIRKENPEAAKMVTQGFRTELDRLTQGQRAAGAKVKRILDQPYNREKLSILVGPEAAKKIAAEINRQALELQTFNVAIPGRNSLTAAKQESMARMFPQKGASKGILPEVAAGSIGGLLGGLQGAFAAGAGTALRRLGKNASDALSRQSEAAQAEWIASFLTSSGTERAAMVKQLEQYSKNLAKSSAGTNRKVLGTEALRRGLAPTTGIATGILTQSNQ